MKKFMRVLGFLLALIVLTALPGLPQTSTTSVRGTAAIHSIAVSSGRKHNRTLYDALCVRKITVDAVN
jgi:hypothetical protein